MRSREARLLLEEKARRSAWELGTEFIYQAQGLGLFLKVKAHTIVSFAFREILSYLNRENGLEGARCGPRDRRSQVTVIWREKGWA